MPIYTNVNIVTGNPDGSITFTPSGSAYAPTSSNASTAGQIDIVVSSHPISNLISNTELNPYLQIPLISGSHLSGTDSDLVIRFYSQSHIQTKYVNTVSKNNDITGYISSSIENFYVTASSTETFQFRDIPYITNDSGSVLRDKIFNVITGSAPHRQSLISASLHQSSLGGVKYFSCSIHYNNIRGNLKPPTRFTGSFSTLSSSLLINNIDLGSGAGLNFTEALIMPKVSSSLQMQFDPNDPTSIEFTQGTSSLSYVTSGRTEPTLMYFSSSGNVGVGTQDPKSTFDVSGSIKSDELVILGPTEGRPIKIKDTEIKFYETQETDPQSLDFGPNKEKARIRAVTGSFNLVFEVSSSNGYTNSVYISQSGKIGFNTDDPQSGLDAVVDEAQFQKPGSRAGLKINSEGNIESFDRSATTAATGSEVILKYSRGVELNSANVGIITGGTIEEAVDAAAKAAFLVLPQASQNKFLEKGEALGLVTPPAVGDVLGQVRWVAESGSIGDVDERVAGETAVIKAVVSAADDTGTSADLIFSVAGKTDGAQQKLLLDATNNHQLTGSLNVSGDVLATNVIASTIRMTNIVTNRIPFFNGTQLDDSIIYNRNGGIDVEGNITSSGNISASGELRISSIKGNNPLTIYSDFTNRGRIDLFNSSAGNAAQVKLYGGSAGLELQRNTGVVLTGDLTASGNISASGDGYFSNIYIPEGNKIIFDNETASDQFIRGSDSFITIEGDNNVNINADEAVTITTPSITASGNISASGDGYFANVGIGTTTPVDLLQIGAGGAPSFTTDPDIATTVASTTNGHEVAYQLHANEGTNNIRSKYFVDDTTLEAGFDTSYSTGLSGFVFQLVGSEKMRINVNGNVGIGTSTPPEKLTVTGNISASGNIEASTGELNGNLTFNGDNRHIYFGGTNTFIGERSNSTELELRGGGSNTAATVYIDNSGNLGLGVSNPLEKLHVDGNAVITGTLTAQEFHTEFVSASIIFSSGSTKFGDTSDDIHQFSGSLRVTGSGDHYILGGNVGVGTASPGHLLEVRGTGDALSVGDDTNTQTYMRFANERTQVGYSGANAVFQGGLSKGIRFNVNNNSFNSGNAMAILADGNVGIGTTAPTEKLQVTGNISASGKVVTTEIESSVQLLLDATNDITIDAGGGDIILSDDGVLTGTISLNNEHLDIRSRISNRDIRLKGNDGGTEITAMTIDMSAAGRVGIGTTAVSAKLHLSGSNGDAAESTLRQSRAGVKIWDQAIDSSGRLQWGYRSSEGGSRTVTFTLDDNNNVGIGTSAPSTKLHVDGDTLITGSAEDLLHVKTSTANKGFIKIESTHVPRLKLKSGTETMEIVGDAVGGFISGGGYIFNTPTSRDTFHFAINNTPKMTLEAGRLGIGQGYLHSNVPSEMLDVSGSAIVRGHITASGNISASGNLLVGGISAGDIKSSGDLKLRTTSADGDILLQSGSTTMFSVDGGLGRNKSFQHLQMSDGKALYAGDGLDLGIYHVSNNSYIENLTGDLTISNTGGGIVLGGSATQHITASGNISSSGTIIADKIGVGTSNPTSTAGSDNFIQIYGAVDSGLGIKSNNADWEFKNENPTGNLSLFSAGSSRVTFKEAGNVGIGTTAPPEKLTVVGNISASGQYIYGDTATPNLRLSHAAGSILSYGSSQLQNGGSLQFVTSTGTVFRVNQGGGGYFNPGNIGFGTTSAPERITVEGNISASGTVTANAFVGDGSGLTNIPAGTTFTNISASGHISASEFVGGQGNPDVDTGTETVATATGATAAFFDYVAKNGTNLRAGTVTSVTDGTNVEFNEVSTVDLGDTSDIKFSVVLSSGDLLFKATVLSDNWNIKALVRKL